MNLNLNLKIKAAGLFAAAFWMFAVFSGAAEAGNDPLGFGDKLVKANLGLLSLRYSSTVYAYLDFKEEESADKAYNEHYRHDHLPLPLTVWEDWAADTAKLYKGLASNDVSSRDVLAFSFAASFDQALFEAQNPGYRSTSPYSYTDFEAEYKKRVERRQNFALETLRANNTMANASLSPRVPDMLQLHLSSSATLGYRQGLQAGSQTVNFMNQGLVLLRMDMLRQLEAETFFALDEAQEDSDKEAAFEVGMKWRTQATGKNY